MKSQLQPRKKNRKIAGKHDVTVGSKTQKSRHQVHSDDVARDTLITSHTGNT